MGKIIQLPLPGKWWEDKAVWEGPHNDTPEQRPTEAAALWSLYRAAIAANKWTKAERLIFQVYEASGLYTSFLTEVDRLEVVGYQVGMYTQAGGYRDYFYNEIRRAVDDLNQRYNIQRENGEGSDIPSLSKFEYHNYLNKWRKAESILITDEKVVRLRVVA